MVELILKGLGDLVNIDSLNNLELQIIGECLNATGRGPFFPDWEFDTLFGISKQEILEIAHKWPSVDLNEQVENAIINSLNNLLGYPHNKDSEWGKYISESREFVQTLFEKIQ